jgi:predicted alpha/beta-hydrolase family hydrolase
MSVQRIQVPITPTEHVTAIVYAAAKNQLGLTLALAHGAGGNQTSKFMVDFAQALAARGIDTITFNFLYSEAGRGLPDRNDKLETCYLKIIEAHHKGALGKNAGNKLVIGGKSMGGRIASQVAARKADGIAGLVLLGYPLHPPGRPDKLRSKHLPDIEVPILFVQGSRDAFGTPEELQPIIETLEASTDLYIVEGGDHSFKVPKRSSPPQDSVDKGILEQIESWLVRRIADAADRGS